MGYTILAADLPANWGIRKEEGSDDRVDNLYQYSKLNVELHLMGQRMVEDPDAPLVYNIVIMAGGMLGGADYWLDIDEEITEFGVIRNYALAVMERIDERYRVGKEDCVGPAVDRVENEQHG